MEQISLLDTNPEYQEFVDKFKPKKTTDDCYTPPRIYEVIKDWAVTEYGLGGRKIIRPFFPGGDYERAEYPDGCVVIDNPPFSILSKIVNFYLEHGIDFFLFAPSLTAFGARGHVLDCCHIITDSTIIYENGATVKTSFVTSFGGDVVAKTEPTLTRLINEASKEERKKQVKQVPKYQYPDHILTAAMLQKLSKYGISFEVRRSECVPIGKLDSQARAKKAIFGGGLLLAEKAAAEKAAAEKAAAEKAAAEVWTLSEREKQIIATLG